MSKEEKKIESIDPDKHEAGTSEPDRCTCDACNNCAGEANTTSTVSASTVSKTYKVANP
jgi:hypothetical protein